MVFLRRFLSFAGASQVLIALCLSVGSHSTHAQAGTTGASSGDSSAASGPIRLRLPNPPASGAASLPSADTGLRTELQQADVDRALRPAPSEFELYIRRVTNDPSLRRFGADLVLESATSAFLQGRATASESLPDIPNDYRLGAGDELIVNFWGSVDADVRAQIDRAGRISIPRVGSLAVAGLTVADATAAIDRQAKRVFKNFELSVAISQLRRIRVFVTGYAVKPGAYTVSALTPLSFVLLGRAAGPSASGSFRDIELRRAGKPIARLDLYDLMLFGRRDADQALEPDDVIHVGAIGAQAALIGSVNKPAIFEFKRGETVSDLLRMGGGYSSIADRTRVAVERLSDRSERRIRALEMPREALSSLEEGDVVRAFSAVDAVLPLERQNKRVRIEGEVLRPGNFILPPGSSIVDAVAAAGGFTPNAFLYGTEFYRETVRATQQINYDRALRDMELDLSRRSGTSAVRTADEAAASLQQQQALERMLGRLRDVKPSGRVVLQIAQNATELPALALEDGDRLFIPSTPTTVGVFGSVFNAGSYLYGPGRRVDDYLRLAGSPTRGADRQSIFVVRANGTVISAQQSSQGGAIFRSSVLKVEEQGTLPGDTIFVPEEANKTTFIQLAKDWTQVLYQLGLGLASVVAVTR
jgi:protein involved in polysaccharide export with SLBB domain